MKKIKQPLPYRQGLLLCYAGWKNTMVTFL